MSQNNFDGQKTSMNTALQTINYFNELIIRDNSFDLLSMNKLTIGKNQIFF